MNILSNQHQLLYFIICCCALFASRGEPENVKSNVPKEILDIFKKTNNTHNLRDETYLAGSLQSGHKIFAEGSSIILKEHSHKVVSNVIPKSSSMTQLPTFGTTLGNKPTTQSNITTLDFLPSSEEASHASGTSSITPQKDVQFSKIVPKKGVNFVDFMNCSLPMDHSCFIVNQTNCHDMDYYKDLVCSCCENSNELGKIISHQPLTNCSSCTPVNKLPIDLYQPCSGICCENITLGSTEKSGLPLCTTDRTASTNDKSSKDDIFTEKLNKSANKTIHSKKKMKPTVTNVPYDSDVSNPFSKSKGEKYIPIIVSIFVLPLVGILIIFMWKKTREFWERRYYRRMDFLIDGMYNE